LKERGEKIKFNEWKDLKKVNERLDALKNRKYLDMMVPVGAFVTFESEDGYQKCLSLS